MDEHEYCTFSRDWLSAHSNTVLHESPVLFAVVFCIRFNSLASIANLNHLKKQKGSIVLKRDAWVFFTVDNALVQQSR